ncbi:putative Zn-dependent protease [Allocatelliglobosispora scoriae]|uniref:Putative Zn-dependent protease n=1 Tax=Allocatelliglobosispora scoriae TaxID=643052 RepID=A0A841BW02_9ACTN|nr:metallopeptidase TldD-related protein [Allocatelliglobosispora scoriae]MBB5871666.1 putative Zn-dependent protease [Allocatelliglobosispora scoriae]
MSNLDIAGRVLDLITAAAPGADASMNVERQSQWLTRFATSFIHQNVADEGTSVTIAIHTDGRTATGSTTMTGTDGLRDLVDRTVGAARLAPADPGWPGLPGRSTLTGSGTADEATAAASPDERAEVVRAFVEATGPLESAGYCRTVVWAGAHVNTAGQQLEGRSTLADFDGIARLTGSDGVARLASTRLSDLDGARLGEQAAGDARRGVDPVELPAGRYEVVLRPEAVADLLTNLSFYGFNGKAHNEGRCYAKLGEAQFDPTITIFDDPVGPGRIGVAFDGEGTPRRALTLVSKGVTSAVVHDRRTAAVAGAESTGHAVAGGSSWGPQPVNLGIAPGDDEIASMISRIGRGLLVSDFWYTRALDPRQITLTGLTRNGVWLIEGGEIVGPVRNFRFTQSYPQALAQGNVLGVSRNAVSQPTRTPLSSWSSPALHLAEWNFTGTASG